MPERPINKLQKDQTAYLRTLAIVPLVHVRIFIAIIVIVIVVTITWGCSSVGRASDRHAADAGSIPRCGKGLFSQSQFQCRLSYGVRYTPVRNRMHLHLCAR